MKICLIVLLVFISGCASQEHRREALQNEHPECFVFHDLTIECPNPFDSSAGFGTSVTNEKVKKKK
jgi:hypothetical protein